MAAISALLSTDDVTLDTILLQPPCKNAYGIRTLLYTQPVGKVKNTFGKYDRMLLVTTQDSTIIDRILQALPLAITEDFIPHKPYPLPVELTQTLASIYLHMYEGYAHYWYAEYAGYRLLFTQGLLLHHNIADYFKGNDQEGNLLQHIYTPTTTQWKPSKGPEGN